MAYGTLGRNTGFLLLVGILFLPGNSLDSWKVYHYCLTLGRLPTFSKLFL